MEYLRGHLGKHTPHPLPAIASLPVASDNCLEAIRISIMCSADLSIYTFEWEGGDDDRPYPKSRSNRKCVDWDALHSWAHQNMVPLSPTLLRTTGRAEKVHMRG
jgi:hypothetical protein